MTSNLCNTRQIEIKPKTFKHNRASLVAQQGKNLPAMRETWVQSLGWEDPLEKGKAADAAKSLQSCPTLCDPTDGSPPGSALPGVLQARLLKRVAIFFSRGSSQPRVRTQVSRIVGGFSTSWATREAQEILEWVAYPFSRGSS